MFRPAEEEAVRREELVGQVHQVREDDDGRAPGTLAVPEEPDQEQDKDGQEQEEEREEEACRILTRCMPTGAGWTLCGICSDLKIL